MMQELKFLIVMILLLGSTVNYADTQNFRLLHEFSGSDGQEIFNRLLVDGGKIYGTAVRGGTFSNGVLFSIDKDGGDFRVLHHFEGPEGRAPFNGLIKHKNKLIGVTRSDTENYNGTLFQFDLGSGAFTVLHRFAGPPDDGKHLIHGPILLGDTLYGLTNQGGKENQGVLYAYSLEDNSYHLLYQFNEASGTRPFGSLIFVDPWLYGMTSDITLRQESDPPNTRFGTIFRIKPDGSEFSVMHRFSGASEGGHPYGNLTFDGQNTFFGMTLGEYFNVNDEGVIFSVSENFDDFTVRYRFSDRVNDGSKPNGDLIWSADKTRLYGITHGTDTASLESTSSFFGSYTEFGTLFEFNPDTNDLKILHHFNNRENGITPERTPSLFENTLYGATAFGGKNNTSELKRGAGTVFAYTLPRPNKPDESNSNNTYPDTSEPPEGTDNNSNSSPNTGSGSLFLAWLLISSLIRIIRQHESLLIIQANTNQCYPKNAIHTHNKTVFLFRISRYSSYLRIQ